jgi:hypothetical protein
MAPCSVANRNLSVDETAGISWNVSIIQSVSEGQESTGVIFTDRFISVAIMAGIGHGRERS